MRFFLPIMLICSLTACKNERKNEKSIDALTIETDTTTTYQNNSAVSTTDSASIKTSEVYKTTAQQQTPKSSSKKNTKDATPIEESAELSGVEIKNLQESESNENNTETESVEKGIRNPVSKPTAIIKKETPYSEKNNSSDKLKTLFKK